MRFFLWLFQCYAVVIFLLYPDKCRSEWQVSPIRLDLTAQYSTGAITVKNFGNETIHFQVRAMSWTQENNKDLYNETQDLIFFPKIFALEGGKERVIRVGTKNPSPQKEQSYRLFIETIPTIHVENDTTKASVNLAISVRFGVPIFVKPAIEIIKPEVAKKEISHGTLSLEVVNRGNCHFYIDKVILIGRKEEKEMFRKDLDGWYVLSGAKRTFTVKLEKCEAMEDLFIQIKGPGVTLNEKLKVHKENCLN